MNKVDTEKLKEISLSFGVISDEENRAEVVKKHLEKLSISYKVDIIGNILVGNLVDPKVAISAHIDEVGFMVSKITKDGLLGFYTLGYIHPHALLNTNVEVKTSEGKMLDGYVVSDRMFGGGLTNYELKHSDLYIDLGLRSNKDVVKKGVYIGATGTYKKHFSENEDSYLTTSVDNVSGIYMLLEILKDTKLLKDCVFVFHRGEEMGSLGANYFAQTIKAPFSLVVDYIPATVNGGNSDIYPVVGGGPALLYKASNYIINHTYVEILNDLEKKYPFQKVFMSKDSEVPHFEQLGSIGLNVCVPARGFHGVNYVISKDDIVKTKEFLDVLISTLLKESVYKKFKNLKRS